MKRDHINYFAVGSFVVLIFLAFFVLMYFVTGRTGPSEEYFVLYRNVAGLKFGTGVFYDGYRVGQVDKIERVETNQGMRYRLTLSIRHDWKIPDDSVAKVVASGLISAVQIGILGGNSAAFHKPGDTLKGAEQINMFAALNEAAGEIRHLSRAGIMPLIQNLNDKVNQVSGQLLTFEEKQLQPFMNRFDHHVNDELLREANVMMKRLSDSAAQLQIMLGESNTEKVSSFLTHIDDVALNLNALITRIEQTRQQMNGVLTELDDLASGKSEMVMSTLENADTSMKEMRVMMKTINTHLDSILYHAEGSTRHMNEFAKAVRENPSRLLRGTNTQEVSQ